MTTQQPQKPPHTNNNRTDDGLNHRLQPAGSMSRYNEKSISIGKTDEEQKSYFQMKTDANNNNIVMWIKREKKMKKIAPFKMLIKSTLFSVVFCWLWCQNTKTQNSCRVCNIRLSEYVCECEYWINRQIV